MAGTSLNPSEWFREIILPQIEHLNKTEGDYLAGTMRTADEEAGTFKFPRVTGSFETYKLTGAIQPISGANLGIDYLSITPDDFEASGYLKQQDLRRVGPALQSAFAEHLSRAVAKRRDYIKLDALAAYMTVGSPPATIGSGAGDVIDITDIKQIAAEIRGAGFREAIFMPIPEMWFSQLTLYKEFANSQWVGPDLPLAKAQGVNKRTYDGINIFTLPDEYFNLYAPAGGTALYSWCWCQSSMAAHHGMEMRNPTFTPQPQLEGTPYLAKVGIAGAALGLNPNGVRRLHFSKITTLTKPA